MLFGFARNFHHMVCGEDFGSRLQPLDPAGFVVCLVVKDAQQNGRSYMLPLQ